MKKTRCFGLCLTALFLTLTGCSMGKAEHSGFLGDYSKLKPEAGIEGMTVYRAPGFDAGNYDKFVIDPIGVHFAPAATGTAVSPDDLKKLTDYFRTTLVGKLSKNYKVVDEPGAGVMRLRIAITDVKKTTAALNIHPATKLSGVGLGGASVEAEGVDTVTDRRMFAFVHTRAGDRIAVAAGLQEFGHAKQAIDFWCEKLVERLDIAHGRTPAR